jgi:hypothetical protein
MRKIYPAALSWASVLILAVDSSGQVPGFQKRTTLRLEVRVYNMAKVSQSILVRAEEETSRLFREAGVETEWIECPCALTKRPSEMMLRIIPRYFGSMKSNFRSDDLGFAPSSEDGGVLATIFFDRVELVAKGGPMASVLGNVIGHEIGHLMLGSNAHSSTGIMTPHWSREFLKLASQGLLHFTPEQGERLRQNLSTRAQQ